MRKQPQQAPPQPPADSRESVSQWDAAPRPAKSRYCDLKFELSRESILTAFYRRMLIEAPEFCLGRQAILTDLAQHARERVSTGCVIVFVPGSVIPAGSGKTCLARRLAHIVQDTYKGSLLEIPLGGSSREAADVASLKMAMVSRLGGSVADLERSYQGLYVGEGSLRNGILLLDDARGAEQVLPLLPVSFDCLILVTSRCLPARTRVCALTVSPRVANLTLKSEAMRLVEVGPISDADVLRELPAGDPAPALRSVSRMYNGIAANLLGKGRTREAEDIMRRALTMRQKTLGDAHPDVASSMVALASVYYRQSRYAEAEGMYRTALGIQRAALGEAHKDTGQTLNNLASALNEQGKYKDAEELYRNALQSARRAFGDQHPDTASILQNLASVLTKQRKLEEAEASLRQALTIRKVRPVALIEPAVYLYLCPCIGVI